MSALREVFARFTTSFDDSALVKGDSAVEGLAGKIRALGTVLAGGFVGRAIVGFAHQMAGLAGDLEAQSTQLGLTTRDWQAWTHGAAQVGVSAQGVEQMLAGLTRRATEAASGSSTMAKAFRELGVETRDATGAMRPSHEMMLDVMDALERLPTQAERVTRAQALLGSSGRRLLPMLQQGRGAFEAMGREVDELGGGISDELVARSSEASAASARLSMALLSLRSRLAVMVLPAVTRATEGLSKFISGITRVAKNTKILEASAIVAGVAAAAMSAKWLAAFGPMALKVAIVAAGVAVLVLVVDELLVSLDGGDSMMTRFADATADFFDQMRGQKGVVASIAQEWERYVDRLERGIAIIREWLGIGPSVEDMYGERSTTQRGLVAPGQGVSAEQDRARAERRESIADDESMSARWERLGRTGAALQSFDADRAARPTPRQWEDPGIARTTERGLAPPSRGVRAEERERPVIQQTIQVDVTAQGPDARIVAREAAREVRRELAATIRDADDALGQGQ